MGLPLILLSYVLGLAGAPWLDLPRWFAVIPFFLAPLWFFLRTARGSAILLCVFFLLLGAAVYQLRTTPPSDPGHIRAFIGDGRLSVVAKVLSVSRRPEGRSVIDLRARRVVAQGIAAPVQGKLRLYIGEGKLQVAAGDIVRFRSRLRSPRLFGTPGEFHFPRYLAAQGIFATAFLPSAEGLVKTASPPSGSIPALIERWRSETAAIIDNSLPPETAALVRALVIGDKGGVTPTQRELLGRAGISHLFAISGLHLGLIASFLYAGGRLLYSRFETLLLFSPPRRCLTLLLLPALWLYLLFTGSALPTLRAFLMTLAGALLFLGARRTPPLKLLTAATFFILIIEPLALFTPSFQLSFAGVYGLLMLLPRWQNASGSTPSMRRKATKLALATVAATIATIPLVLLHFHLLAPAGLLANLAAVPAIGLGAVPLGLAGVIASSFSPEGAAILFHCCGTIVQNVLALAARLIDLPLLGGALVYASPRQICAAFLLAGSVLLPRGVPRQRSICLTMVTVAMACLIWPPLSRETTVTALSVGHGDALLFSPDGKRHYLIDGGGLRSETFDVGERLLAPALGRLGVRSLEAVILTHDDHDHRQGLLHILETFPVREFWAGAANGGIYPPLREILEKRDIAIRRFPPGWTIVEESAETTLRLYTPGRPHHSKNDNSLVLYFRRGQDSVLLTGDLEEDGVKQLLASDPPQPATLLKLPHHGSRNSTPGRLLAGFTPALAFVSTGAGHAYDLPHPSVIDELRRLGIPLHRTDLHGSLRFSTLGAGWQTQHWRKGLFR